VIRKSLDEITVKRKTTNKNALKNNIAGGQVTIAVTPKILFHI
jgi:hypothetical protein